MLMKIRVKNETLINLIRELVTKRILFFGVLLLLVEGLRWLIHNNYVSIPFIAAEVLQFIVVSILALLITNIFLRLTVGKVYQFLEGDVEPEQRMFFTQLYTFLMYGFAVAVILSQLGISWENITLIAGLLTTAFALAIRDVINSIMGWMIILVKKPFRLGDFVKIGDDVGEVIRIGTFYITLVPLHDKLSITKLPNKVVFEKSINNYGRGRIRKSFKFALTEVPPHPQLTSLRESLIGLVPASELWTTIDIEGGAAFLSVHYACAPEKEDEISHQLISSVTKELKETILWKEKKE